MAPCGRAWRTSPARFLGRVASRRVFGAMPSPIAGMDGKMNSSERCDSWSALPAGIHGGRSENTGVWFGEVAGLIHAIEPAEAIIERMASEAALCLATPARNARLGARVGYLVVWC